MIKSPRPAMVAATAGKPAFQNRPNSFCPVRLDNSRAAIPAHRSNLQGER